MATFIVTGVDLETWNNPHVRQAIDNLTKSIEHTISLKASTFPDFPENVSRPQLTLIKGSSVSVTNESSVEKALPKLNKFSTEKAIPKHNNFSTEKAIPKQPESNSLPENRMPHSFAEWMQVFTKIMKESDDSKRTGVSEICDIISNVLEAIPPQHQKQNTIDLPSLFAELMRQ